MVTVGCRIECRECKHDHPCKVYLGWIVEVIYDCDECGCKGNPNGRE